MLDTTLPGPEHRRIVGTYRLLRQEIATAAGGFYSEGEFDLIHRVTPLTPTMGSPLAGLTDVPLLIGPLNGGLPWPKEYPELRRKERE